VEPVEVPPSTWAFPATAAEIASAVQGGEVAVIGGDLEPGTILAAYRAGLFPMPLTLGTLRRTRTIGWWSPDPRGIVPLDGLHVSRSLRKSCSRYQVRLDTAFDQVIEACADPRRPGAWIDDEVRRAYRRLHRLGWAHSVEAWDEQGLAGGLYGLAIGGLFAGESMFHHRRDASKVALVALVGHLRAAGARLLDVQWATDHLRTLGAVEIPRPRYHELLAEALAAGPETTAPDP
jgi:leucyl/phenylalanyl-tRNA--protein transferase